MILVIKIGHFILVILDGAAFDDCVAAVVGPSHAFEAVEDPVK